MIYVTCRKCDSKYIRKNGFTKAGTQKYYCKSCGFYGSLYTKEEERKKKIEEVEKLHRERVSQRGIAGRTGLSRNTIIKYLKKKIIFPLAETIHPSKKRPILELDEMWSFVGKKEEKVWIWLALERNTRKIVGLAFGNRSDNTCRKLWSSLPPDYRKRAVLYSDYWESYGNVLPSKRHRQFDITWSVK